MSNPSNSHPSHAAMPERHCAGLRLRKLSAGAATVTGGGA